MILRLLSLVTVGALVLTACSGGGDSDASTTAPTTTATVVTAPSLSVGDLPGLLPDAAIAGELLGVTIDTVDETPDLSQTFEHTDTGDLLGAYTAFYRTASGFTGNGYISLALYETAEDAEAAMSVILEEDPGDAGSEFVITDLADAARGYVIDDDSSFTWAMLRYGNLLAEISAFHEPGEDLVEAVHGLGATIAEKAGG